MSKQNLGFIVAPTTRIAEVAPSASMNAAESEDFMASIERGLAQLDVGQKISGHKVRAWAESLFSENQLSPPRPAPVSKA